MSSLPPPTAPALLPLAVQAVSASPPWRTATCLALCAAIVGQLLHEAVHGVVAIGVGKQWEALHLFAFASSWPGAESARGDGVVAASAALFNILAGVGVALALLSRTLLARRPTMRLWLFYFAAFSLLAGFGYLMMDALFYRPGSVGDWRKVIGLLGGGWQVRGPILAVGAVGTLAAFFWIPWASLEFLGHGPGLLARASAFLLIPFLVVCASLTLLSAGHPLGLSGVILTAFKYWLGYSAMAWAAFIAASMAKGRPQSPPRSLIPAAPALPHVMILAISLVAAGYFAMPLDPSVLQTPASTSGPSGE